LLREIERARTARQLVERGNDIGCHGAIVGRALYENRFTLEEALAAEGAA
jgi:phosphoribosylformimino-5-aminoimidazole carboxamide ribonucleotide (ProFAR) isomerase